MTPLDWGFLLLDKPEGPTSFTAVRRAAKALGFAKAGHAGTLDPMATGLMLVGLGRATRLLEYLVGCDKTYIATVKLGIETDTLDREGEAVRTAEVQSLDSEELGRVLSGFLGRVEQVPPRHSAVKVGGVALHRRARRGEEFEVPSRTVEITRIKLLAVYGDEFTLEVDCSSGTYVRSLARDIGANLGLPASLWALRRTRCGPFRVEEAAELSEIVRTGEAPLLDPALMVGSLARVVLDSEKVEAVRHGRPVEIGAPEEVPLALFDAEGKLLALGESREGRLSPVKVFC